MTILTRVLNWLKLTWMIYWRAKLTLGVVFNGAFSLGWETPGVLRTSAIVSAIMVFVLGVSIRTFPILRFLGSFIPTLKENGVGYPIVAMPTYRGIFDRMIAHSIARGDYGYKVRRKSERKPIHFTGNVAKSSGVGRMTGYEPSALADTPLPTGSNVIGVPGKGLHSSGFSQGSINAGVKGEETFAKALVKSGLINRVRTYWSVKVPRRSYNTDVDCVIYTDNLIFLVDIKMYQSGDVTYRAQDDQLYCIDNATGALVGSPKTMSRNMDMARDVFREEAYKVKIVPVVVFVPTDKGEPNLDNVVWPGDIPAFTLSRFMKLLRNQNRYTPLSNSELNNGTYGNLVS